MTAPTTGRGAAEPTGSATAPAPARSTPRGVTCQQSGCQADTLTFAGPLRRPGHLRDHAARGLRAVPLRQHRRVRDDLHDRARTARPAQTCVNGSCGKRPIGASCAGDGDCNSGICAQGTCCATACDGICLSCALPGSAGSCTSVPAGQDPLGHCADNGAATCGTDGTCDGAGVCRLYGTGTICGAARCAGDLETPAARCDGVGDCVPGAPQSCGAVHLRRQRRVQDQLRQRRRLRGRHQLPRHHLLQRGRVRAGAAGRDLHGGRRLRVGLLRAGRLLRDRAARAAANRARWRAARGPAPTSRAGQDPQAACADQGAASCGTDGACDGSGKCEQYAAGTSCAPATCAGTTFTAARSCDGAGSCQTVTTVACVPYACNAAGNACNVSCAGNGDCAAVQQLRRGQRKLRPEAERRDVRRRHRLQLRLLRAGRLLRDGLHRALQLVRCRSVSSARAWPCRPARTRWISAQTRARPAAAPTGPATAAAPARSMRPAPPAPRPVARGRR